MSNPYAPPEDRRGAAPQGRPGPEAPRAPGQGDGPPSPWGVPPPPSPPGGPPPAQPVHPAGAPVPSGAPTAPARSPEGVPYEGPRRGSPAPGGGPQGPAPRPQDVRRLVVLTRTTALLVLGTVIADLVPFPWYLAAVPLALAALVVAARGVGVAGRTRQHGAPRAVLGMLMIVALLGLSRPGMALLTWDAESQYARCTSGALTVQAQNACVSQYQQNLDDRAARLTGRTP